MPEERAAAERGAQPLVDLLLRAVGRGRRPERGRVLAEVDRDAVEAGADPDHLARGAERVELLRPVAGHAPRQDVASPRARPAAPGPAAARALRAATRGGRCRASSAGSVRARPARRARPRAAAPPATRAAAAAGPPGRTTRARVPPGPQLAAHQLVAALELPQHRLDVAAEALVRLAGRERPARAREAAHERVQRLVVGLEEDLGQAARRHRADGVAVAPASSAAIRRCSPATRTWTARRSASSGSARSSGYSPSRRSPRRRSRSCSSSGVRGVAAQLRLDLLERAGVDQVAQLLLAEQLAQQVAVERQRLRPPLGGRRVVLVHVVRDVVEEQRGRVRRGRGRLDVDEVDLPRAQALQQPLQRRQVEDVLQALAVGLEHDRERRVAARDLQQRLRLQALLPERRALARAGGAGSAASGPRSRGSARRRAPCRRAPA